MRIVKTIGNASNQPISLSPRQNRMIHRRVIVPFNILSQRDVSFYHNKRTVTLPSPSFTTLHTCDLCPCVAHRCTTVAVRRANNLNESTTATRQWLSFTTRAFVLRVCPAYSRAQHLKTPRRIELSLQPTLDIAFCTFSYFFSFIFLLDFSRSRYSTRG